MSTPVMRIEMILDSHGAKQELQEIDAAIHGVETSHVGSAAALTQSTVATRAASAAHSEFAASSSLTSRALQSVKDYTSNVSVAFQNFEASAQACASKGLANVMGALSSMSTLMVGLPIVAMINDFIHAASALDDMSLKTGIGVVELGRLQYAGGLVGISLEQMSTAAVKLQDKVASGDKSAVAALRELGVNVEMFTALEPAQQFEVAAGALGRVANQGDLARLAIDLFGRTGQALIPLFKQNLQALGDEGERFGAVMSTDMVSAGDRLGDILYKVWAAAKNLVALPLVEAVDTWGRAFHFLHIDDATEALLRFAGVARMAFVSVPTGPKLPGAPGMFAGGTVSAPALDQHAVEQQLAEENRELQRAMKERQRIADEWRKVNDQMTGRSAADAAFTAMKHLKDVGGIAHVVDSEMASLTKTLNEGAAALFHFGKAAGPAGTELLTVWAGLQKANMIAPGMIGQISDATLDQQALADRMHALAQSTVGRMGMPNDSGPSLMLPDMPGIVNELTLSTLTTNQDAIDKIKLPVSAMRQAFTDLGHELPGILFDGLKNNASIGQIVQSMAMAAGQQLQQSSSKGVQLVGVGLTSAVQGYQLGASLGKGKGALAGAASGALAGSAFGPWGTAIGAGVGAIAGWWGGKKKDKQDKAQMEDQRAEMLAQFGGMEKLQQKAKDLGLDMTKAFNTKKPQEFRAEVEKLNAAMEAHAKSPQGMAEARYKSSADQQAEAQQAVDIWAYMSQSGKYSASVVQQAWDEANSALIASGDQQALAAQAANSAVSDLSAKILGLQQSYANEAPEEVMGNLEAIARAQVAALEEQRAKAQENIEAVKNDLAPLVEGGIKVPIDFWVRTGIPGVPGSTAPPQEPPSQSSGGFMNTPEPGQYHPEQDTSGIAYNAGKEIRDADGNLVGTVGTGGGDGSRHTLTGGSGTSAPPPRSGTSTIVVNLDSRTVIEQIVPYLPGELQRLGLVP